MKTYKEVSESVLKRRDEYFAEQKRKKAIIIKTASSVLGAATAACIGIAIYNNSTIQEIKPDPDKNPYSVTEVTATKETTSEAAKETTSAPEKPRTTTSKTTAENTSQTATATETSTGTATASTASTVTTATSRTTAHATTATPTATSASSQPTTTASEPATTTTTTTTRTTTNRQTITTTATTTDRFTTGMILHTTTNQGSYYTTTMNTTTGAWHTYTTVSDSDIVSASHTTTGAWSTYTTTAATHISTTTTTLAEPILYGSFSIKEHLIVEKGQPIDFNDLILCLNLRGYTIYGSNFKETTNYCFSVGSGLHSDCYTIDFDFSEVDLSQEGVYNFYVYSTSGMTDTFTLSDSDSKYIPGGTYEIPIVYGRAVGMVSVYDPLAITETTTVNYNYFGETTYTTVAW